MTTASPRSSSLRATWRALFAAALVSAGLGVLAASCGGAGGADCAIGGKPCALGCSANVGCAECGADGDCSPGAPFCVLGECVACRSSSDCGAAQACFPRHHECQPKCASNASCTDDRAPLCDPDTGACVGCLENANCPANRPFCEPTRGQCSECAASSDCGAAAPICDLDSGECRQCLVDGDCQAGYLCAGDHRCHAGCKANADCGGDRPLCNLETGACVGCVANTDCGAAAPLCRTDGRCSQCIVAADCPVAAPFCDSDKARCVQCTENNQCPSGMKCKNNVCEN